MFTKLVRFQVHVRLEYDKLLLHAFSVRADKMVLLEVLLEGIIVEIVMRLPRVPTVADEAPLMFVPAVLEEFVVVIEALATETAKRVSLKPRCGPRLAIAMAHVITELLIRIDIVFVRKHLLVPSAEIAHLLVMDGADMTVQIGPAESGKITVPVRAIIPQKEHSVSDDILAGIPDPDIIVRGRDLAIPIVLKPLCRVVGEDDIGSNSLSAYVSINLLDNTIELTRQ